MEITVHLPTQHDPIRFVRQSDVAYHLQELEDWLYVFVQQLRWARHDLDEDDDGAEEDPDATYPSHDWLLAMRLYNYLEHLIYRALWCHGAFRHELGSDIVDQLVLPL
jgi:hypothetical protein